MDQYRQLVLVLLAIAAVVSLAAVAASFYEIWTGRLVPLPIRWRVPTTQEDIRKNALASLLTDLASLLIELTFLLSLLPSEIGLNSSTAIVYWAAGGAGLIAAALSTLTSIHIRGEVRYRGRETPSSDRAPEV
jgi:hypothetical protein